MERVTELCTICSKLLVPANNVQTKLLQTPCSHLFHRTCLKIWLRGTPSNDCCPRCSRLITWQDVSRWKPVDSDAGRNSRVKKEEPNDNTGVPSLLEETKHKNAEKLIKKRLSRNPKLALLELQKQETLERQKALAEKMKLANIKDKMCKGYEKRTRIRYLKRVALVVLLLIIIGCLAVYICHLYRQANQAEELQVDCLRKTNHQKRLFEDFQLQFLKLKQTKEPRTNEERRALKAQYETFLQLGNEIKLLTAEYKQNCIVEISAETDEQDKARNLVELMKIKNSITGNGWSMNEIFDSVRSVTDW